MARHPLIGDPSGLRPKRMQFCILRFTDGCEWEYAMAYWTSPTTWFDVDKDVLDKAIAQHLVDAHNDNPHLRQYFV